MASIAIFTNRQGNTRYRVRVVVEGTMRNRDYRTLEEACFQLYLSELHKIHDSTPLQFLARRDFTVRKAIYFYLGSQWEKVRQKSISEQTFRNAAQALLNIDDVLLNTPIGKTTKLLVVNHAHEICHIWLRAVFRKFIDLDMMKNNPCPKPVKRTIKKTSAPPENDIQRLYDASDDPCVKMFIYLAAVCGLRTGEALGVRRDDIQGRTLNVKRHLTPAGMVDGTKGDGERKIPLPEEFFLLLEDLDPRAPFLVYSHKKIHLPVNLQSFRVNRMRPLYRKIGVTFSNHALRHFASENWMGERRPLKEVQTLLGHRDPVITMRYYGHMSEKPQTVKSTIRINKRSEMTRK